MKSTLRCKRFTMPSHIPQSVMFLLVLLPYSVSLSSFRSTKATRKPSFLKSSVSLLYIYHGQLVISEVIDRRISNSNNSTIPVNGRCVTDIITVCAEATRSLSLKVKKRNNSDHPP